MQECLVKDENGRLLTDEEEKTERWASIFKALLNHQAPVVLLDIPDRPLFSLHISDEKPKADELLLTAKKT